MARVRSEVSEVEEIKRKLKVLITTYWYAPMVNGVVMSVQNLASGLRAMGHDVRVLTVADGKVSYQKDGIYYMKSLSVNWFYPNARLPFSNRSFIREIKGWKPDIIHSQCELFTFNPTIQIAKATQAPIVHTYHTVYENYTHYFSPSEKMGRMAAAKFSELTLNKTMAVIAPSNKVRNMLLDYGVQSQIFTVPSGIDMHRFEAKADRSEAARLKRELGIPDENTVLINVGRLAKEKNLDEIITDMTLLPDTISLLIVGEGPYRMQLEDLVSRRGLSGRVIFTGLIKPEEVAAYYNAGDIFVNASRSETQGLTYFEAMACGLPIVCYNDPCLDDVIINGVNGCLFDSRNEFCDAVRELAADSARYERMSILAKDTANRYSSDTFAKNILDIYYALLDVSSQREVI
jgi:1,2-diacylglycerol 3-alpha-glucosyltransferase